MVTKRQPQSESTYEEQVAIARANLERHIPEVQAERERALAAGIDPEAELHAWVRESFSREALFETYQEYLANPSGWLGDDSWADAATENMNDSGDAR